MRLILLLGALFSGLAAAQAVIAPRPDATPQVYAPGQAGSQQSLSEDEATKFIVEDAKRRGFSGMVVFGRELQAFVPPSWVQSIGIEGDTLEVVHEKGRIVVRLSELQKIEVITDTVMGSSQFGVPLSQNEVLWAIDGGLSSESRRARAFKLADALQALRKTGASQGESDVQFEIMARNYRSTDPKPAIPEEVRKFQVQADFAIDMKRYKDAAGFYAEGIKLAPWWATGRFNRALLLAETGQYREAAGEMKRFLVLAPESPDARVAQDRIYQWEAAAQLRR
jgi:tetratricopeptide (TPR) repeat protein